MDGQENDQNSGAGTVIVRQFAPSRIERQLLAQIFELVCGQTIALTAPGSANLQSDHRRIESDAEQTSQPRNTRRRAA